MGEVERDVEFSKENLNYIYYDKLQSFEDSLKGGNKKIVIFIDDLDRCAPDKVLEILESIKVFLDIEGFVYVFGINPEVVEKAIEMKYKDMGINGEDYLEKIIQIPFKIPDWNKEELNKCLEKMYEDIDSKYKDTFEKYKDIILEVIKKTPRQLKRFINSYICEQEVFKNEKLDLEMHLVLTILKFKWYDFYSKLFDENFRERLGGGVRIIKAREEFKNKKELYEFIEKKKVKRIIAKIVKMKDKELSKYRRAGLSILKITQQMPDVKKITTLLKSGKIKEFNKLKNKFRIIDLSYSNLNGVDLRGIDLININLRRADLTDAHLTDAHLTDAHLNGANLWCVNLIGANLIDTDLIDVVLNNANFSKSIILLKKFVKLKSVENADFKDAIINNEEFVEYLKKKQRKKCS
ncbi:MAG: hypothetical protein DRP06_03850 [Candidatus Aenigmatarchaeota archaeon]|nr:MAG: hypothetical protein DRP06_03850 [Candidatus Aenigmarchaeota archaeon]